MRPATHERRCTAHRANGLPCKKFAILGGTVCDVHGGRAPQVKRSAQERLAEMVEPALVELRLLVQRADSDSVRLSAIKDILDRAGYKAPERVAVTTAFEVSVRFDDATHRD